MQSIIVRSSQQAIRRTPTASRTAVVGARLYASSSHKHDDHHHHPTTPSPHKPDYLKVAREWPSEAYAYLHHAPTLPSLEKYPDHPDGSETTEKPETFFNAFWGRVVLLGIVGVGAYQLNKSLTEGQEVHPITRILGSFMQTKDEYYNDMETAFHIRIKEADGRLISLNKTKDEMPRTYFPERFLRASDHLIEPGSQIDVSDIKIKHSWQRNDDLFGVPYPKDK
ncbi:hypothetical protein HDU76_006107 [Blyttiomyces sp. JEL0837]|nr:hypothetical protein HDU76_006107 [Blyttiomyces sp. JEL0837]